MATLKNIGLALSGGGYRAAAYHLGVLTCLHKVGLLENVSMISSVSGGSITAIKYATSLVEKKDFDAFSRELEVFLKETDLITEAIKLLGTETTNRSLSHHTLITAFAELYHNYLLSEKTKYINSLWMKSFSDSHLKEVCFNSTEFHSGNSFRFIKSQSTGARFGNGILHLNQDKARKLRLGDILAASSCFPSGFEPIDLIKDFAWDHEQKPSSFFSNPDIKSVPLMDGGIYDNQGLEGIKLAVDRKNKFDTVIISDTDQEQSYPLYQTPARLEVSKYSLKKILNIIMVLSLFVFGSVAFTLFSVIEAFFPFVVSLVLVVIIFSVIGFKAKKSIERIFKSLDIPSQFSPAVDKIYLAKFDGLINAIIVRAVSLIKLTSTIFMKRIRGQVYKSVFVKEELEEKIVSNLIYELNANSSIDGIPISKDMLKTVIAAKDMPTTLWFTEDIDSQFKALKNTGEITTAFNLIKYIDGVKKGGKSLNKSSIQYLSEIRKRLKKTWNFTIDSNDQVK